MDTNGVPFKKSFRDDNTGADFTLENSKIAHQMYCQLKKHKKIKQNFDIELPKDSNIIKIYYK